MADEKISVGPYVLVSADRRALNWAVRRSPAQFLFLMFNFVFLMIGVMAVGILIAAVALKRWFEIPRLEDHIGPILIFMYALSVLYVLVLPRVIFRPSALERARNARPVTISISPDGIETQTGETRSSVKWQDVDHVAPKRKHVFFFLTRTMAFIAPRRAFATPTAAKAFADAAMAWHAKARQG